MDVGCFHMWMVHVFTPICLFIRKYISHVWRSEDNLQRQFSLPTMWALGIKLSGSAQVPSSTEPRHGPDGS